MSEQNREELWGLRITAVLMALLLFLFVSYENSNSIRSTDPSGGASVTGVEVLTDIPIEINIDHERYYVTGIPETATVQLSGTQSIITQTLATQNIVVETPNLTELGPGTHTINLDISDLSSRLNYSIEPASVTITIEERVTQDFPVKIQMDESYVADGYNVGTPQLSHETVTISGLASDIEAINEVAIIVPPGEELYTETLNLSLPVAIYDANEELIDATSSPSEVAVTIPIEPNAPIEKTVPLNLNITNEQDGYNYSVGFASAEEEEVTLEGPQEVLDNISEIDLVIDVSKLIESTTLTVPLSTPRGVTNTSLQEVRVTVNVEDLASIDEGNTLGNSTTEDNRTNRNSTNESENSDGEDTIESTEENVSEEDSTEEDSTTDTSNNQEDSETTNEDNPTSNE